MLQVGLAVSLGRNGRTLRPSRGIVVLARIAIDVHRYVGWVVQNRYDVGWRGGPPWDSPLKNVRRSLTP